VFATQIRKKESSALRMFKRGLLLKGNFVDFRFFPLDTDNSTARAPKGLALKGSDEGNFVSVKIGFYSSPQRWAMK